MKSYESNNMSTTVITESREHTNVNVDVPKSACGVFDVCRFSELDLNERPNNHETKQLGNSNHFQAKVMEISNGFIHYEKAERRDSGFHTMSRYSAPTSESDSIVTRSQSNASHKSDVVTKPPSGGKALQVSEKNESFLQRKRSSPLMTKRKWMKNSKDKMSTQAIAMAQELFHAEGEAKNNVIQHLSKTDEFGLLVARKYMEMFNFSNVSLDESLRLLLKRLALLGETQERERVLFQFSSHYKRCNPRLLDGDIDVIHTLVCAIALLNTDLHGPKISGRRRMTCKQFTCNLANLGPQGRDFPTTLLKELFRSIKKRPLPWCNMEHSKTSSSNPNYPSGIVSTSPPNNSHKPSKSKMVLRSQSMNPPSVQRIRPLPVFNEGIDGHRVGGSRSNKTKTLPRKQGVLWRKSLLDSDGNKNSKRKRRWKLMAVALQGLELHLAKKDSTDASKIALHHCLAEVEPPNRGTKRMNVFRLTLANTSVALYQTSSKEEQRLWVKSINRNAALLSAAPLSAGVGSQIKFQRPLLPSASSTLPLAKQLQEQQDRLDSLSNEMDELNMNRPPNGAPTIQKQFHSDKEAYLLHEIHKYEVYTSSLSDLLSSSRKPPQQLPTSHDGDPSPDTESLLSVSPSEPGAATFNQLYLSDDRSGSVGDLLDSDQPRKPRHPALSSPLSPTSSLPNLHPLKMGKSPQQMLPTQPQVVEGSSPGSESLELVPAVAETKAGNTSVRLIRYDVTDTEYSPSITPSNSNNSNHSSYSDFDFSPIRPASVSSETFGARFASPRPNTNKFESGFATTGRIESKQQGSYSIQSNSPVSLISVKRHFQSDVISSSNASPLVVSTSYLSNMSPIFENKMPTRGEDRHVTPDAPIPRVRGRKERRGSSRYSYLQAVHNPSKLK